MQTPFRFIPRSLCLALSAGFLMAGCGDGDTPWVTPAAPTGLGSVDTAAVPVEATVLPFVDNAATNQRGDARYATLATNAGVRVAAGFLDIWTPSSLIVDAGVTAAANGSFPGVVASTWSGIPGDSTDGTVRNATVHTANIQYVVTATTNRTAAQAERAYLDDRRAKAYSVSDGMGPLTTAWRTAAQQTTTITSVPADATTVLYNDGGNDVGVGGTTNTQNFGAVVDLVGGIGENGSTEPAKRFYKYARPWRWSSSVVVVPTLVPAKSSTPMTDGGFISGHSAEGVRRAIAMGYVVPERFQELLTRGGELGESRILSGMHSPLDVIGGRVHAQAVAAASLYSGTNSSKRVAAAALSRSTLMAAVGAADATALYTFAHSQAASLDRFADHATNKASYRRTLTYGFTQIADTTKAAVVPKGAEVLLETRLPYLSDAQRRVVLKTTAIASGYPVLDDAEGWGRLNLFDAADGYGLFAGDVVVVMDASLGGFNAADSWRNAIGGAGLLTKRGSGALTLTGNNSYSGGTLLEAGTLVGTSASAFGSGDVFQSGGTLRIDTPSKLSMAARYTQTGGTLQLVMASASLGQLAVASDVTLAGALKVSLPSSYKPAVGTLLNVLTAGNLHGRFTSVTLDGYTVTPVYTSTGVQLRIDA
jgi:autotransporter-associated beta strand protein